MVVRQGSEQVDQDNCEQQPGKKVRTVRVQLSLRMRGLSVSVLLVTPKVVAGSRSDKPAYGLIAPWLYVTMEPYVLENHNPAGQGSKAPP